MIQILAFDFDLTIVNSLAAGNKALEDLERFHGIISEGLDLKQLWGGDHVDFAKSLAAQNNNLLSWEEIGKLDKMYMEKHYGELVCNETSFLREISASKLPMLLITNNTYKVVEKVMSHPKNKGIAFDQVYTFEDPKSGSKVDRLGKAITDFSVAAEELIYIGDHPNDIAAAREAGVMAGAVASGFHTRAELEEHKPDLLLDRLSDLRVMLEL